MSAFDDGPIAPGRVDVLVRQLMERAKFERARDLADIMFDWWRRVPLDQADPTEASGQTWWWLGIMAASSSAAYGAAIRASRASSPRGRAVSG